MMRTSGKSQIIPILNKIIFKTLAIDGVREESKAVQRSNPKGGIKIQSKEEFIKNIVW